MNVIAFDLILVLFLQSLIVSVLILSLFRLRSIFGLGLLFIALGVFQFMQVFLYNALYFEITPSLLVSPGTILFTGSLFAILLIYIREGALEARKVIYAIIASNLVLLIMQYLVSWKIDGAGILNIYSFPRELFIQRRRVALVFTSALFLDVFVIIVIFEIISKYVSSLFFRIFFSMTLVLSLDSILFSIGVYIDTDNFLNRLTSNLISKISAAFIYSIIFAFYLGFLDKVRRKNESKSNNFKDVFSVLTYRQKYELVYSEKVQLDKQFKEQEFQFKTIFEKAPIILYVLSEEGKFISINPFFEKLTGWSTKDWVNKSFIPIVHPEDLDIAIQSFKSTLEEREVKSNQLRILCKSGAYKMGEFTTTLLESKNNSKSVLGIAMDITERKTAEEKIIEERNKAKQYLDVAGVMLVSVASSGIVQLINPKGCEILGYTEKEIIGTNWIDNYIPELDRKHMKEVYEKVFNGEMESVKYYENKILTKSGQERLIAWHNEIIRDNKDGIISVLSSGDDVTKNRQAELELKENEERFRKVFDEGPLGIVMTRFTDRHIINANQALCKMLGYTKEELLQLKFTDVTHPNYQNTDIEAAKGILDGSILSHNTEKQYLKKNGEVFWAKRALSKIMSSDGKTPYALAMISDITEQKLAEQELKNYQKHLQELVQERTNALSNSQNALLNLVDDLNIQSLNIDVSNKKLASKNEELEAFTYSVSHDLRSPLRHIDGFANILLKRCKSKLDEKELIYFNNIIKSALQMNDLIDGLLVYSKMGSTGIKKTTINMKIILDKVIPIFVLDIKKQNISLIVDDMPDAFVDAFLMTQVWENLISNAIKFSSNTKNPKIHIGYEIDTEENIIYFIKDNGAGFDQKYVDKAFGVFQRLHSVNEFPGTGIGLATTKLIIMKHDGVIWAEGMVNRGASFFLKLPNI
jgi:PAS domain S-box-containing protein